MKLIQFKRFGPPAEVMEIVEQDIGAPGAGEVLIDVEAAPVHIADIKFMSGSLPFYKDPPGTPGMEGVGRIRDVGDGVTALKTGQRVFLPVRVGLQGAWRQQVILKPDQVVPAPEGDARQLCLVPINGATSYVLLHGVRDLKAGDWILQNAANSNCGRWLIVLAKRKGVKTVNIVRRPELIDELKALGADVVLLDGNDLDARVREATGGAQIPLAIDAVAGKATQRIAETVAMGATILAYGMLSGEPSTVFPQTLFMKNLSLQGFLTTTFWDRMTPDAQNGVWEELPNLVASGVLEAKIAATYTLDQVQDAVAHAARTGAERDGKIIIFPNGEPT